MQLTCSDVAVLIDRCEKCNGAIDDDVDDDVIGKI